MVRANTTNVNWKTRKKRIFVKYGENNDSLQAARDKMSKYDRAVELCPAKQITLNRDNLPPAIIVRNWETAGFKREDNILQVHSVTGYLETFKLYFNYFLEVG